MKKVNMKPERPEKRLQEDKGGIPLDGAPLRTRMVVEAVEGGIGIRRKLSQLGIYVGDELIVKHRGPIGGPVNIRLNGIELAIGRGMAKKVLVNFPSGQ